MSTHKPMPLTRLGLIALLATAGLVASTAPASATYPQQQQSRGHHKPSGLVYNHQHNGSISIRIGDLRGRNSHALTHPGVGVADTHPQVSPDRRWVLFNRESDDAVQIVIAPLTGHAPTRVIDTGCDWDTDLCAADIEPTWAPSGKRIVFTRVTGPFDDESGDAASALLFSTRLDGSHLRRVSPDHMPPTAEDNVARFTPDGRQLVFIRDKYVGRDLHYAVYRMRRDGTAVIRLTPWALDADRATPSPATYGPGAGLIAFETHGGWNPGRGDVALIPVGCRSVKSCMARIRYVTHNNGGPKSSFAATWSPNGRRLAFAEEPDTRGKVDVWTSRWDGSRRHQVTHTGADFSPAWSY